MRSNRVVVALGGVVLAVAACGGDSGAASSTTTVPATSSTVAPATTAATTTTVAETTTTTLPADLHPVFGVRWADVWPSATMSAAYLVTTFGGEQVELAAHMEYGVEFAGGTHDRLVVGSAEPGEHGMVIYFDRTEPWQIVVVGEESFSPDRTDRADSVYVFETPLVIDGLAALGETAEVDGRLALTISTGDVFDMGVTYAVTLRAIETAEVPAGTFGDVLAVDVLVSGELIGGGVEFPVEILLHADQFIVGYTGASGFDSLVLASPWQE